jgi:hypothetical protein
MGKKRESAKRSQKASRGPIRPDAEGVLRLPHGGEHQLEINTSAFPVPQNEYYANAAHVERLPMGTVVVSFAQMVPRQEEAGSIVMFEMPMDAFRQTVKSFGAGFREVLQRARSGYGPMTAFPLKPPAAQRPGALIPAHFARIHVGDLACTVDFFELTYGAGPSELTVATPMRVRCLPPIVAAIVDGADAIVSAEMP